MVPEQGRKAAVTEGERMGGIQRGREYGAADTLRAPRSRHEFIGQVGRIGRSGSQALVDELSLDEPSRGVLPGDERAPLTHPPLEPVHVFGVQVVAAHGHDQGRIAIQVKPGESVRVDQGNGHAEPLVEQVPGLADLIGPCTGTGEQGYLRLDQHGGGRAAQIAARGRQARVRAVNDNMVFRDDAVDQFADLFGRHRGRGVALGDGDDDRTPVESLFRTARTALSARSARSARGQRKGFPGHPGP